MLRFFSPARLVRCGWSQCIRGRSPSLLFFASAVLISTVCVESGRAQAPGNRTMGRYGWRWHSPPQYGNTTFTAPLSATGFGYWPGVYGGYTPFYGYGGYGPSYGSNFYESAARGRAAMLRAQGNLVESRAQAAESAAEAAESVEEARAQYLENVARFEELRREHRMAEAAREAQEAEERRTRAANYEPPAPTELYSRLSPQQIDPSTGEIDWPAILLRPEFAKGRRLIEDQLQLIAEEGANPRSAAIIRDTANEMKPITNTLLSEIGFNAYRDTRDFLGSLSVEGYYALEGS